MEMSLAAIHRTSMDFHHARARPKWHALVCDMTAHPQPTLPCLGASVQPWFLCSTCSIRSLSQPLWALQMCNKAS